MASALNQAANSALQATGTIKLDLQIADHLSLAADVNRRETLSRSRAWTYVWLAGILERFVEGVIDAVTQEINTAALQYQDTRVSLLSLGAAPRFQSLQQIRGLEMWNTRIDVMQMSSAADQFSVPGGTLSFEGRTIEPEHFTLIWKLLGLGGDPLPSAVHKMFLLDLRDNRNKLAHGEIEPGALSRRKPLASRPDPAH